MQKFIVVDWGTSSLRAMLTSDTGNIIAQMESEKGIQFIKDGNFEAVLMDTIAPWLGKFGPLSIIALGMISSKNGWIEVPYVSCPATLHDLAAGTVNRMLPNGSKICFLAGIIDPKRMPFPDVMRGEETQILGTGLIEDSIVVLPGTHSKWAKVSVGQIDGFQTFVTGELYSLLSRHSFIARSGALDNNDEDWNAFDQGVMVARDSQGADAAFLTQLFSVRTGMLAGDLTSLCINNYLSGLLIGEEFQQAQSGGWFKAGDTIGIVGNNGLSTRYSRVACMFELNVWEGGEQSTLVGALGIFKRQNKNAT